MNWDDGVYVAGNQMIRSLSNIGKMITTPVQGNYHPLTMISLAINYSISGLETGSYHILNTLIHVLNTILVFWFVWKLTRENLVISYTAALLFGVHPMHVESVAWVTERKDVLYAFFFLLGLIAYIRYLDSNKRSALFASVGCLVLSLASKPAAIVFPLALFTIDFFRARKLSVSTVTEKIPFIVLAAIIAFLTLGAQSSAGATDNTDIFPLSQRFFFGFYSFMTYTWKMLVPIDLSAFYPMPLNNQPLDLSYMLSPLFFVAVAAAVFFTYKKTPIIAWGLGFFFVNLILILQFKVVGSAIVAERYTYVPYIGLFVIVGWAVQQLFAKNQQVALSVVSCLGIVFSVISYNQAGTWKNSASLWDNAIAHQPSARAYHSRANLLREERKLDEALKYYNEAIQLNNSDHEQFCNRANVLADQGHDSLALLDYNRALEIKPNFAIALDNRGSLYIRMKRYDDALRDFNRALEIKPEQYSAYSNRALVYYNQQRYDDAISEAKIYLSHFPNDPINRNTIGISLHKMGRDEQAIPWFSECIARSNNTLYLVNRSSSYYAIGKLDLARADALEAKKRGANLSPAYLQSLGL